VWNEQAKLSTCNTFTKSLFDRIKDVAENDCEISDQLIAYELGEIDIGMECANGYASTGSRPIWEGFTGPRQLKFLFVYSLRPGFGFRVDRE